MDQDEFESELRSLFSNCGVSVDDVNVFEDTNEGLKAWVILSEDDELNVAIGKELRDRGFSLLNHQGESRYEDAERDGYLVWSE